MRVLGLEIKRATPVVLTRGTDFEARSIRAATAPALQFANNAPKLPPKRADGGLTDIMPPFGTNPPSGPLATTDGNLTDRLVNNDPRELWYLNLPSKLAPKQVLQILRSALGGDLWQQWQLLSLMLDSWPMLRKCSHELREPVSNVRWTARPYCPEGDEPSPLAQEKASLLKRAMNNFDPNQYSDEKGWNGMIYDITDAMLNGLSMSEIMWHPPMDWGGGVERLPRAVSWVHPRNFTFSNDGNICVFDQNYQRLMFPLAGAKGSTTPDPRKFLCSQFLSRSGSSLGAGFMRPLAWYWAAVVFNREWMMKTAQNYGAPFLDVVYQTGMAAEDLKRLDNEVAAGLANRFIRHVEGTTIEVTPSQSLGSENPQRFLAEQADQACAFLLLGQEATTKTQPGQMGGKDTSKTEVKRERVEGLAKWVGTEVLNNFVKAVLFANYGNNPQALLERPIIEPDFTAAVDPMAQAQRDQVFLESKVPMLAEEFYRGNNLTAPEPGDLVIVGGVLGKMADMTAEVGGPPPPPPGLDADGNPVPPQGDDDSGGTDGDAPEAPLDASLLEPRQLNRILAKATKEELEELLPVIEAAERATHLNGEHELLKRHLKKIHKRN